MVRGLDIELEVDEVEDDMSSLMPEPSPREAEPDMASYLTTYSDGPTPSTPSKRDQKASSSSAAKGAVNGRGDTES